MLSENCYTWKRSCLDIPVSPCAAQFDAGSCGETQNWFWMLTAGLAAFLVLGRKR